MSDIGTRRETPATPVGRGRALSIALWVLQVLLALQFLMAGFLKVGGNPGR